MVVLTFVRVGSNWTMDIKDEDEGRRMTAVAVMRQNRLRPRGRPRGGASDSLRASSSELFLTTVVLRQKARERAPIRSNQRGAAQLQREATSSRHSEMGGKLATLASGLIVSVPCRARAG